MHNENKIPSSYSTLNNDVIPDDKFLNEIDKYHPKLSQEIVKQICQEKGLLTTDNRIYKLISIVSQQFLEEILNDTAESIISKKKIINFWNGKN